MQLTLFAVTLGFGLIVAALCTFATPIGERLGLIDYPDGSRKRHHRPTPLVGGIALMLPLLPVTMGEAVLQPWWRADLFTALGLSGLGFLTLGLIDDRHHLAPRIRLLLSGGLCSVALLIEPRLMLTELDFGPFAVPLGLFAAPFTVLCLVGLQNAVNMADGLNGLVIGLALFWTLCLLLYAPDPLVPYLASLLLGLSILLPYNLNGRLFLGDAGAYPLGVGIGLLMIYVYNAPGSRLELLTVALWLGVPVLDCLRVMLTRLLAGRSPFEGDRNHLHHRLAGRWPWPRSVGVYLALATGPGVIAALWPTTTLPMLALGAMLYAMMLVATRNSEVKLRSPLTGPLDRAMTRRTVRGEG